MSLSAWFVYIVEAENGHFYTGITTDLARRLTEHQTKQGGARFFHTSAAKQIVYQEPHPDRSSASKREAAIKKLSRKAKITLIDNQ
ncbi:MAG: GIY-YIG nuclease family protein [Pseudomonadota bacterium]|jgi:putative endonuclease|nr:GIY-YIG nuclease family protein [Pseudomonadota bacterium]MDO7667412.1 GIY-YIG nuclease family protein [Pseudomonadota bacterium]MDO7711668.1 GIY-YIG nuclease family protein [Pseudomonadota bacterium]